MRSTLLFTRRHPVALFYLAAYLLTWVVWGSIVAQQHHLLAFHLPQQLGYYGVMLAAVITAVLVSGKAGLVDLVKRMVRVRVAPVWYAVALFGPLAISLAAVGIYRLFGGVIALDASVTTAMVPIFLLNEFALFLGTEELGWRGFALPRLQSRYGALGASVIVGVLWGVWHTPLFLNAASPVSQYPYVAFLVFAVAESILITWVYNHTRGSVALAALLHAATDVVLVYNGTILNGAALFWVVTGVAWLVALALIAVEGPATLAGARRLSREAVTEGAVLSDAVVAKVGE